MHDQGTVSVVCESDLVYQELYNELPERAPMYIVLHGWSMKYPSLSKLSGQSRAPKQHWVLARLRDPSASTRPHVVMHTCERRSMV